jgi:hypothetical protein
MAMVGMAFGAIAKIGIAAAHDLLRQDQLFEPAAKMPHASTPEWMAACRIGLRRPDAGVPDRPNVGKHLTYVRDGLMDATGALYDLEDDDPLAVPEEEDAGAASRTFSTS